MNKNTQYNKINRKTGNMFDLFGQKNDAPHYPKPAAMIHPFYVSGAILSCDEYTSWFDTIRNAGPDDTIIFHINSPGGDLMTGIQFMRVIAETQATVVASVEGSCMSAATLIFLAADHFQISEHSSFMFHNYSGGTFGKGGEMYDCITFERQWSSNLVKSVYKNFLTEDEIDSILDNKDIWMEGEEVGKRLDLREKLVETEMKKRKAAEDKAAKASKPKKTPAKQQLLLEE